jgi:putative flippase GtrA
MRNKRYDRVIKYTITGTTTMGSTSMTYLPWRRNQRYDRVIKYTITGATTMGSTCMTYLPWRSPRYDRVIKYTNLPEKCGQCTRFS